MTNIGWQIVPLDETLLAQWATLRQQLWPHHALSAHLQEGVYVQPASRQRGVAQALIAQVTQWGRELGCRELASDAAIDNLDSQQMHQQLGFAETERVVFFKKALG
ncbi:GNAT family N-acetyltransferase [Aeromonas veronii]